jgi:enoyl-CoA hydratase
MIQRDLRDGVLALRLAHGKANALDLELVAALGRELEEAAACRAVILTGTGRIFSAGVDLKRFVDGGPEYARRFFPALCNLLRRLFTFEKPVVAAVNGHAVAGGCLLVFACDHRVMASGSGRIGLPELQVGLPFPAIAHEIVRFAVPAPRVQPLVYAGATLPTDEALAAGFVEEVVPPDALEPRAREVAAHYGRLPAEVFAHTKRFLRAEALGQLAQREADADAKALAIWCAAETHRRVREYVERTLGR